MVNRSSIQLRFRLAITAATEREDRTNTPGGLSRSTELCTSNVRPGTALLAQTCQGFSVLAGDNLGRCSVGGNSGHILPLPVVYDLLCALPHLGHSLSRPCWSFHARGAKRRIRRRCPNWFFEHTGRETSIHRILVPKNSAESQPARLFRACPDCLAIYTLVLAKTTPIRLGDISPASPTRSTVGPGIRAAKDHQGDVPSNRNGPLG